MQSHHPTGTDPNSHADTYNHRHATDVDAHSYRHTINSDPYTPSHTYLHCHAATHHAA